MKKEYWFVLFIQVVYVLMALSVALVLWTFLPEVNEAIFSIGPFRGGGAFAGFVFVWWYLKKVGLTKRILNPVQAGILLTPSEKEAYNALFDGFTNCDFFAFNPPFKLEGEPGDHLFEEALATHKKRYLEGQVKSRYMFFDKISYERAQRFFNELAKIIGEDKLKRHLKITYWENSPELPGYTYFIGHKGQNPFCIFYPSAAIHKGLPEAVIYIKGAEDFLSILRGHFQEKWDQAQESLAADNHG